MPFTLSHPAAVLPVLRNRYFHAPALVLGSMSPDFLYFLGGKAAFGGGHTWAGMWLYNLPLCVLLYGAYRFVWRDVLRDCLPKCVSVSPQAFRQPERRLFGRVAIFFVSAWLGMLTHIVWDGWTHQDGWFVLRLPWLAETAAGLPWYKWLQYGGGVAGLLLCAGCVLYWARRFPYDSGVSAACKFKVWGAWLVLCATSLMLWQYCDASAWRQAATWAVRAVDCAVLSWTIVCAVWHFAVRRYQVLDKQR